MSFSAAATALVAALHIVFMLLESVLWTRPAVRRAFGMTAADAEVMRLLAANQGVYNGMIAVGLAWSTWTGNTGAQAFLLVFVVVVGLFGGATVKGTIVVLQALPALIALVALLLGR